MNILLNDDIDFATFMDLSDHGNCVRSANDYADDLVRFFHDETVSRGAKMPWRKSHGAIRFREGEVSIWTGYNGSGKSLLLGQVVLGFLMQGERTCIASMEMKPVATLSRMARQGEGASRPSEDFLRGFVSTVENDLWFYDQLGMVDADKITGVINYAAKELNCKHFVVDSLLKCGIAEDDYNGQKRFVDRLCTISRDTGIHIHLVAHSRKGKDEMSAPGKMDVRGAASITDQVDNVFCVWRNKPKEVADGSNQALAAEGDTMLDCAKQRHGEWEGRIQLWFNTSAQQFVESPDGNSINLFNPSLYA